MAERDADPIRLTDGEVLQPQRRFSPWRAAAAVLIGLAGVAEVELGYLALRPRLPSTVALHYGSAGTGNSFGPPVLLAQGTIEALLLLTALFAVVAAIPDDERKVTRRIRGREISLVFLIFPVLLLLTIAGTTDLLLAGDAGVLPAPAAAPGFAFGVGLGGIALTLLLTVLFWFAADDF